MRTCLLILLLTTADLVLAQSPPVAGNLHVKAVPGVRIYVDGRLAGVSTVTSDGVLVTALAPGEHTIRLSRPSYQAKELKVTIAPGETAELDAGTLKLRRRIRFRPAEEPVDRTVESPPMFSDDTSTPGDGNLEINSIVAAELSGHRKLGELPRVDVNYGYRENLQFKLEVPLVVIRSTEVNEAGQRETRHLHGIGNSTAGVKFRFYDNDATNLALAVYPQVEFHTPGTRTEKDGGGASSATTWSLPFLLTKELEHVAITANTGVDVTTDHPHTNLFVLLGAGTRLTDKLALLAEVAGTDLNRSRDTRILLNVGFRKKAREEQSIGAAIGHDLRAGADDPKRLYLTFAYQRFIGRK